MAVEYVVSQGVGKESGSKLVVIERREGEEGELMLLLAPGAVIEDWRAAELQSIGEFEDFTAAHLAARAIVGYPRDSSLQSEAP
jgi:hypothetical protein